MKKIILSVILSLIFPGLNFSVYGFDSSRFNQLSKDVRIEEGLRNLGVFADPDFSQPTNNFSPGQKIYLRIETMVSGNQEKTLSLLNTEKTELKRITLNQAGSGPYFFTTSFNAPGSPGVYYLDIRLKSSDGSVFSSQRNINVGQFKQGVSVSSEVEVKIDGKTEAEAEFESEPEPTFFPEKIPESSPAASNSFFLKKPLSFSQGLNFLKDLFSRIFSLLAGIF
jgi:hypothetical protein